MARVEINGGLHSLVRCVRERGDPAELGPQIARAASAVRDLTGESCPSARRRRAAFGELASFTGDTYDPEFRSPRAWKYVVNIDTDLAGDDVCTVEVEFPCGQRVKRFKKLQTFEKWCCAFDPIEDPSSPA